METNYTLGSPRNFSQRRDKMLRAYTTKWFQANPTKYLRPTTASPTTIILYQYSGSFTPITRTGFGLVNVPFFGMTNTIPSFGVTNIPVL